MTTGLITGMFVSPAAWLSPALFGTVMLSFGDKPDLLLAGVTVLDWLIFGLEATRGSGMGKRL